MWRFKFGNYCGMMGMIGLRFFASCFLDLLVPLGTEVVPVVCNCGISWLLLYVIVYSVPSCASQPLSLHRNLNFWPT